LIGNKGRLIPKQRCSITNLMPFSVVYLMILKYGNTTNTSICSTRFLSAANNQTPESLTLRPLYPQLKNPWYSLHGSRIGADVTAEAFHCVISGSHSSVREGSSLLRYNAVYTFKQDVSKHLAASFFKLRHK